MTQYPGLASREAGQRPSAVTDGNRGNPRIRQPGRPGPAWVGQSRC